MVDGIKMAKVSPYVGSDGKSETAEEVSESFMSSHQKRYQNM